MIQTFAILLLIVSALFLPGLKDAQAAAVAEVYAYEHKEGSVLTYDVSLEPGYPGLKVQSVMIGAKPDVHGNYGSPYILGNTPGQWKGALIDVFTYDDPPIELYLGKLPIETGSAHLFKNISAFTNQGYQSWPWPDWAGYEKAYLFWNDGKVPYANAIANGQDGHFYVEGGTLAAGAPFVQTNGLLTVSNVSEILANGRAWDPINQTWVWISGWQIYDTANYSNMGYTVNGGGYTHPIAQPPPPGQVPIPGSLLLLAPGLLGALGLKRRMKG